MNPRLRKWLRCLLGTTLVTTLVFVAAFVFAPYFLVVESRTTGTADVIIVLGGESETRAPRCMELFRQGAAQTVLVSGSDGELVRQRLIAGGIPEAAISVEGVSDSTRENAQFASRLLAERKVRRALLVTSRYHTRRALTTFRFYSPGVQFFPVAAQHIWETYPAPLRDRAISILREYVKIGWYFLRYGISPLNTGH